VKNTAGFVDQTVNDLTSILSPLFPPLLTKPIDCATQASQCVLALSNPIDCANQAVVCLTK
jgi:hypothetical protein